MHGFVRNLITEWRRLQLPFTGQTVVVAVSGGADSVALLLAVNDLVKRKKLGHRVVAAHFNHKLRGDESDADEKFVRELTVTLGVELSVGRGEIPTDGNLEQNARDARYKFLSNTAMNLDAFAVLTGHTVNDQAETFLMNLIRGSGVEGLSGMPVIRHLEVEKPSPIFTPPLLIRPLLTSAKRIDTEKFCHDSGVEYRYDTMNEDTAFRRVRIRKILLPLLEDFNPNIVETLANTAALLRTEQPGENENIEPQGALALEDLRSLPKLKLFTTIRAWLRSRRGNTRRLQLKHIEAIGRLIFSAKSGKTAELPGGRVVRSGGKLIYEDNKVEN